MQNSRKTDSAAEKVVFATKLEDVIGGITLAAADFPDGTIVPAGTVVGKDNNGLCHPVNTAKVVENATNSATEYKVAKGHNLQVGDFIAASAGAKAYAITDIDTSNDDYDTITVGTTLGEAITAGAGVFQALAESATTTSALKYTPFCLTGHTVEIKAGDNHLVDGLLRCTVISENAPVATAAIKAAMPHVIWL